MSESHPPVPASHHRLRLAALTAVIIGVLLLAAAAFLLSYSGIHHIALQAGVAPALARLYPLIFDAMLVIAGSAALTLRGAGAWMRAYVWLSLLTLLAAVAAGDALQAMNVALPRQPSRAGVAVTPWALLLLGFGFWLAMLRQLRRSRGGGAGHNGAGGSPGSTVTWAGKGAPGDGSRGALDLLLEPRAGNPPEVARADDPTTVIGGTEGTQAPPAASAADADFENGPFIVHEARSGAAVPGARDAADDNAADDNAAEEGGAERGEGGAADHGAGVAAARDWDEGADEAADEAARGADEQPGPVPPLDRLRSTPTPPHPASTQPDHMPNPPQPNPPQPNPPQPSPPQD